MKEFEPYRKEKISMKMKIFGIVFLLAFFSLFIITIAVYNYYDWCLTIHCYNIRRALASAPKWPANSFEWALFIGLPLSWILSGVPPVLILFFMGKFRKKKK